MTILDTLIKHLVETKYESLPQNVINETKKQILDTLAATVAGSTCSIAGEMNDLVELTNRWGGKQESTIVAFGNRVPAPNAAFVNGIFSVRRDFDDTQHTFLTTIHPSRTIVPPAFATAESKGDVNGKDFITAVALGHDLQLRMRIAASGPASYISTGANFIGAAATSSKISGLNESKSRYALGLAIFQMSQGGAGLAISGSGGLGNLKGVSDGLACKAGVLSVLLAQSGFVADWQVPEASGFGSRSYLLTSDLGKMFMGSKTIQKEFPCCHGQHSAIRATLELVKKHDIIPQNIKEVEVHLGNFDYSIVGRPTEKKQNPQNIIETQFSICWGIASAIVYRNTGIRNFTSEALKDIKIQETARKVFPKVDLDLDRGGFSPAIVEIKTNDGKLYSQQVDHPIGNLENPFSFERIVDKFRYCCEYSVKPISIENQDKVIHLVETLEDVTDISQIVRLLS